MTYRRFNEVLHVGTWFPRREKKKPSPSQICARYSLTRLLLDATPAAGVCKQQPLSVPSSPVRLTYFVFDTAVTIADQFPPAAAGRHVRPPSLAVLRQRGGGERVQGLEC